MATSKTYLTRPTYRFLPNDHAIPINPHDSFELNESDLYNSVRSNSPEFRKPNNTTTTTNQSRWKSSKRSDSGDRTVNAAPSSLPVNIPDWSRILGGEYRENNRWRDGLEDIDDDDDDDRNEDVCGGEGRVVPPHEFLARTRIASFSVHEGRGRTLKGRDLSRVRNAIWQKTGFED